MPIRTGSSARLQASWSTSPTVWTMAGWFRLNSVGGMMMFRSRAAADGSIGAFAEGNGSTLTNYTDTTAGGSSDQITGDQSLYNVGAALVPLMMTRNGNVVTLFDPNNTAGRAFNIATAGAAMADVSSADTLAFGAWLQSGTVTLFIDQDCDELAAWELAASATEYADFAAATKPEDIGDSTFKASMFDVWTLNPGGAGGTAISTGATYTGLKNANVLTLTGTTATVSSRAAPVSRTAPSELTGSITADDTAPAGSLGTPPGTITLGPWKNHAGDALPSATIPLLTFLRASDGVQVLTLTNQVTSSGASPSLAITNAALLVGVKYAVASWDALGVNLGLEMATAA